MKAEIHKDEGYKLMGSAFEVYNEQGCGLAEEIYQESLEIELELRGIPFRSKQELKCFYKGHGLKKRYVPDLFVFECLVVELKSVSQLLPEHEAQLINYMRITNNRSGIASILATRIRWNGSGLFCPNSFRNNKD